VTPRRHELQSAPRANELPAGTGRRKNHPDGGNSGTSDGIYDAEVKELGPADRDERGLVAMKGDVHDRMEF